MPLVAALPEARSGRSQAVGEEVFDLRQYGLDGFGATVQGPCLKPQAAQMIGVAAKIEASPDGHAGAEGGEFVVG
jgi:hypothetical protein